MSGSSSVVLKNLKEIIKEQEENIRKAIGKQFDRISNGDHVNSFNDGDDFIPDDRSTPVHDSVETSNLPPIPESSERDKNDSIQFNHSTQIMDRSPVIQVMDLEDGPIQVMDLEDSPVQVIQAMDRVDLEDSPVQVIQAMDRVDLEDSPVKPGVDGRNVKSFEELLELSMRNESLIAARIDPDPSVKKPVVKRPFLKKGEGIDARFKPKQILKKTCCLEKQSQAKDPHSKQSQDSNSKQSQDSHSKQSQDSNSKQSQDSHSRQSQSPKKLMSTKTVNVLPRTDTRGRPIAKEAAKVTGNPFNSLNSFNFRKIPAIQQVRKVSKVSDTSLDNLERLLMSVRSRKEELLQQPLSSDQSSSEEEEEEEEEDSCWEEEEEEDTEESDSEQTRRYERKKRVRWNDMSCRMSEAKTKKMYEAKTKKMYEAKTKKMSEAKTVSEAKAGVYSRSVRNYMTSLEKKLLELQERCAMKEGKKERKVEKSVEGKEDVAREIADLRSQIAVIGDGIKALQLYTSSLKANEEGKKRQTNHQPKVRITREIPVRECTSIKSIKNTLDNDPRFDEDTNVKFGNGDQMQVLKDGTVIYTFSDGTLQTTFPDGSKVVQFKNGQIERTLVNGLKQITYPNKCQRTINPDGSEELIMVDGTITRIAVDGTELVILSNGEREIRSKQYSRREYKNGCVKTIYADGTQETRFPNGRIRIKDKNDKVLVDSVVRSLTQL